MASERSENVGAIPAWQFCLRLAWVVVRLSLVYAMGATGAQFFYQGF